MTTLGKPIESIFYYSIFLLLLLLPVLAQSQIITPFQPRFSVNDNSVIELIGNASMTCQDRVANCAAARNGTLTPVGLNNNNSFFMSYIDVDSDLTTFNSSRALLELPAGAQIQWAGLYWGGDSASFSGGLPAPDINGRDSVLLRTPQMSDYVTINGQLLGNSTVNGNDFAAFADITNIVAQDGAGAYTVANIQSGTGNDIYAGWALIIVYRAPSLTPRSITVFDGYASVRDAVANLSIPVSGFTTPPSGPVLTKVGVLAFEGDIGLLNDSLQVNNLLLSGPFNPANNFFNSSATNLGIRFTDKTPDYINLMAVDIDLFDASDALSNNATSATINLQTRSDAYLPTMVAFSTDLLAPQIIIDKTVTDLNGGRAEPGDILQYDITLTNGGQGEAQNLVLRDPIPVQTAYVAGSLEITSGANTGLKTDASGDDQAEFDNAANQVVLRLGDGADANNGGSLAVGAATAFSFQVEIDANTADGTVIGNQAQADFTSAVITTPLTSLSNPAVVTVSLPQLTLNKTATPNPVQAGDRIVYTLEFTNNGSAPVTGVVISDTLPANTTFVSASANGVFAANTVSWDLGTVAAGASGSVSFLVLVDSPLANGTLIDNSAVLSSNETTPVTDQVQISVNSAPLLSLTKTASASIVAAGELLTYTLDYANIGNDEASNVLLSDTLPANTSFVSASDGGILQGNTVVWNLGTLNAGSSGSVTVTVQVNSPLANGTVLTNGATIDSDQTTPLTTQVPVTVDSAPLLTLSKQADQDMVAPGALLTYTLTYSNSGNTDATNVVLTDPIPANTSFVSASNGGEFGAVSNRVRWLLGTIAAASSASVTLTVRVDSPLADGVVIDNVATIDSTETVPVETVVQTPVNNGPILSLEKIATPAVVAPDGVINYTISFANTGNSDADNVVLRDTLPANTTLISASDGGVLQGNRVVWNIGVLASGASRLFTLSVQVGSNVDDGTTLINLAGLSSAQTPPLSTTVTTLVSSTVILTLNKTATPALVQAGDRIVYTLEFANIGNTPATGVTITDTLPANTSFVSASGNGVLSGNTVSWNLGTLAPGVTGSVSFLVLVDSPLANGTVIDNTAVISSNETTPVPSQVTTTVNSAPLLTLSKTPASDFVAAGELLVYTLNVTNIGNDQASNVALSDSVPANTSFVSASNGGVLQGNTVVWNLGTLNAGSSASVTLTVRVDAGLANGTVLANGATVDSNETTPVDTQVPVIVNSAPLLSLTKQADRDVVAAGALLSYTLDYSNSGNANATNTVLSDPVPANTRFVSASNGGTLDPLSNQVRWLLGTIAAGSSASVTLTVQVDNLLTEGVIIENVATIDSDETVPTDSTVQTPVSNAPILSLEKTATPETVAPGDVINYTISFSNSGNSSASNVVLRDTLPANTTLISASDGGVLQGNRVVWNIGTLASGDSRVFTLSVLVGDNVDDGTTLINLAGLSSAQTPPLTAIVTTLVAAAEPVAIPLSGAVTLLLLALGLMGVGSRYRRPTRRA